MTEEREKLLRAVTDLSGENPDIRRDKNVDDIVFFKQMILKDLCSDKDILEALHNIELEKSEALPEDYWNVNIFSYLKIPGSQSTVKNFICFDINDVDELYYSTTYLEKDVIFRTVSHQEDIVTDYGINRQDLLALLINDRYSWSNFLGMRLQKIYDAAKIAENNYYYREIKFKITSPNAMVQKGSYISQLDRNRGMYGTQI